MDLSTLTIINSPKRVSLFEHHPDFTTYFSFKLRYTGMPIIFWSYVEAELCQL